jgi:lipopolysaccharide transport system ATP-binding protein
MSDAAIRVENLSKKYIIGHQKREPYMALRDVLGDGAKSLGRQLLKPLGKRTAVQAYEEFWALKNVSFEIKQGDRVGIIGRNGAGKSTLLKILSRITEPTVGRISIKGRIASLLEVGTGFHPELTGRENIYLNGAILGMSKAEIKRKFDEIVAFAEVEKFLDTPVKRYSSGMYVRLAFAVAAHLEPEILIVDEVLAVGDAAFQKKCLGKMEDVAEKEGRTVLFVSHNMAAITNVCRRTLWLKMGQLENDGSTPEIVSTYLSQGYTSAHKWQCSATSYSGEVKITSGQIIQNDNSIGLVCFDQEFNIEIEYEVYRALQDVAILIRLNDALGTVVLTTWDTDTTNWKGKLRYPGRYRSVCGVPGRLLHPGRYLVTIGAHVPNVRVLNFYENVMSFEISYLGYPLNEGRLGVITPLLKWKVFS